MYSTPCSFRLFSSKSAPLISAMSSPVRLGVCLMPGCSKTDRCSDYAVIHRGEKPSSIAFIARPHSPKEPPLPGGGEGGGGGAIGARGPPTLTHRSPTA